MQTQTKPFGELPDGRPVVVYTLTNARGHSVRLTNYGAVLMDVNLADSSGKIENINLSFDALGPYLGKHPHFGSTIGRFCNRIGQGRFRIDGQDYQVTQNLGNHHLHGGTIGFDHLLWESEAFGAGDSAGVRLRLFSPAGMEGFPGNLWATAEYAFNENDELSMTFEATADAPTPVNLCNHSYWNLGGVGSGPVLDTILTLDADQVLEVDADLIPTGGLNDVSDTGLDFRTPTPLGARIGQFEATKGYDHCFVVRGQAGTLRRAARAEEPRSGRVMEVWTTQPAVQLYTGNHLAANEASGGYGRHDAFCLETQHHPDAPNHPEFPSAVLRPGETLRETTVHRFTTR
ncbi:MAG: galactose mutarotase [Planctomycetaceae bacterium]|nr:MAG: galactose mutarotase [Planctomycetaceae bacterium]